MASDDFAPIESYHTWYRSRDWAHGEVVLSAEDLGLLQGAIAVERLRTFGSQIFRLDDHLQRLRQTTSAMSINVSKQLASMPEVLDELLGRNGHPANVGIVILVTPGRLQQNEPTVIAHLSPLNQARIDRLQFEGERLIVTSVVQPPDSSIPRSMKHRSRMHYYLANQQAQAIDPLASGVLIDEDGSITETASANILLVINGVLHSPPQDRILPGVSLKVVREIATKAGIPWREQPLPPQTLDEADEILLTGTGAGVWFGNKKKGPIFEQIAAEYRSLTEQIHK